MDLKRIVLSLLEDCGSTFIMRPINWPFRTRLFMALQIPYDEEDDPGWYDVELYLSKDATTTTQIHIRELKVSQKGMDKSVNDSLKYYDLELADVKDFKILKEYLESKCTNRRVTIEFEASDNLDFEVA